LNTEFVRILIARANCNKALLYTQVFALCYYPDVDIQNLLDFTAFLHLFQKVERTIYATGTDRNENDAEHSYQLAMIAWYVNHTNRFGLNDEKLIKYALAHDLVETYAGDTYFHTADTSLKESKTQRERDALLKIKDEFKGFVELAAYIELYEERTDPESRFIYALDKILPVINIYLDKGRSWQRDKVTYEMVRTKDEKVAISSEAQTIWQELTELLDQHLDLFHKP